jgi:hypothetical protein
MGMLTVSILINEWKVLKVYWTATCNWRWPRGWRGHQVFYTEAKFHATQATRFVHIKHLKPWYCSTIYYFTKMITMVGVIQRKFWATLIMGSSSRSKIEMKVNEEIDSFAALTSNNSRRRCERLASSVYSFARHSSSGSSALRIVPRSIRSFNFSSMRSSSCICRVDTKVSSSTATQICSRVQLMMMT